LNYYIIVPLNNLLEKTKEIGKKEKKEEQKERR